VGRDGFADRGAAGDLADDAPGAVPVQAATVSAHEHRTAGSFADGQIDCPGGARRQRDGHNLAALVRYGQGPVPALQAQVLNIGTGGFGDPQPVQREQRDQRMLTRRPSPAATSSAPSSLRSSATAWDS
jgi:hypothetical protein